MARKFKILTIISVLFFLIFFTWHLISPADALFTACITFGVCSYHFLMRLAVGGIVDAIFHNHMNYRKRHFQPRKFEPRLYAVLRVEKWNKHVPTYSPDTFSVKKHSWEEIAMATCQAEIVHEVIVVLSFLPILLSIPFGTSLVFATTSLCAALVDTYFVIIQRYNRPRILALMARIAQRRARHNQ